MWHTTGTGTGAGAGAGTAEGQLATASVFDLEHLLATLLHVRSSNCCCLQDLSCSYIKFLGDVYAAQPLQLRFSFCFAFAFAFALLLLLLLDVVVAVALVLVAVAAAAIMLL